VLVWAWAALGMSFAGKGMVCEWAGHGYGCVWAGLSLCSSGDMGCTGHGLCWVWGWAARGLRCAWPRLIMGWDGYGLVVG
jgi:hypothetical protein